MTRLALSIAIVAATSVAASAQQQTSAPVTFSKDVAPILQRSCQNCHRPGAIAPMSLLTYQDARPWARSIKAKVTAREMPPWYIDRHIGITKFKDDPSLTDAEIATIVRWVDQGAPAGNPKDAPPARQFADTDKWHIGKPDMVVSLPKPYELKATGPTRSTTSTSTPASRRTCTSAPSRPSPKPTASRWSTTRPRT